MSESVGREVKRNSMVEGRSLTGQRPDGGVRSSFRGICGESSRHKEQQVPGPEMGRAWRDRGTVGEVAGARVLGALEATVRTLTRTLREVGRPWRGDMPLHPSKDLRAG